MRLRARARTHTHTHTHTHAHAQTRQTCFKNHIVTIAKIILVQCQASIQTFENALEVELYDFNF